MRRSSLVPGFLCAALASPAFAQTGWLEPIPPAANARAVAFDPVLRRVLLHGGTSLSGDSADLWSWDHRRWTAIATANGPGRLAGHAMVADLARNEVVLFGTPDGSAAQTWLWNGSSWRQPALAVQPLARSGHAMAFDGARNRVVLFGGTFSPITQLGDTWEWNGSAWLQRTPPAAPAPRDGHAMAYDAARSRVVLFGGEQSIGWSADTWEWDGATWTLRSPLNAPAPRTRAGMAYDAVRQRVVLHGGFNRTGLFGPGDTWEWDGVDWQQLGATNVVPLAHDDLVWDPVVGRCVLPGTTATGAMAVWAWDGQAWRVLGAQPRPEKRYGASMAFEPLRGSALLFGGSGNSGAIADTWEWTGDAWAQRAPALQPFARYHHAMTHDPLRGTTVLFGGTDGVSGFGDTWEWNGATWQPIVAAAAPASRWLAAMTFDVAQQRVLLFGGQDGTTFFDDTWTWNGTTWTQLAPAARPPGRFAAALGYDTAAAAPLLFGGAGLPLQPGTLAATTLADTWRFTGSTWQRLLPPVSPTARTGAAVASDPHRRAIVLFGGDTPSGPVNDTWEWDGTTWIAVTPTRAPWLRSFAAAAYDLLRRQVVLHGGVSGDYSDETWVYATRGEHVVYGAGCAGTLGVPVLAPAPTSVATFGGRVAATVANVPSGLAAMAVEVASPFAAVPAAPVPLGAFGMPGCGAWLAPALLVPLVASGGIANWQLDVPWSMGLQGVQLFQQAVVLDLPANAAGLTVSNAARIRIGT